MRRNGSVRAMTGALLIVCGVTGVWVLYRPHHAHDDCAAVEQLGSQWIAMSQSITASQNGPGERDDLVAIADQEAAMAERIRAAAGSVSSPTTREQLKMWAQATALVSGVQRDSATRAPQSPPSRTEDADYYRAAVMTHQATAALLQTCPKMPHVPSTH
jgi:hypothetical protein